MGDRTQPTASGQTVLVVDDDASVLDLCRAILEEAGFTVLQAEGSPEALKTFSEHSTPIDLLITDLVLPMPEFQIASKDSRFPRVHGPELIRHALAEQQQLRALTMSGFQPQDLATQGVQPTNLPFLAKPFAPQDLLQKVKEVLAAPPMVFKEPAQSQAKQINEDIDWFG